MDRQSRLTLLLNGLNNLFARVFGSKFVANEDFLYRRIHPDWQKSETEVSTAAFTHSQLSVDLASLTTPTSAWKRARNTDAIRNLSVPQEVKHWPEMCNWAHSLVVGNKTGAVKNQIRKHAEIVIHTQTFRSGPPSDSPPAA